MKPSKINFPKQNSYKQITKIGNKLLILENWKWLSSRNLFPEKMIRDLLESHHF